MRVFCERATVFFCWFSVVILLFGLCSLLGYLFFKGLPALNLALFFGDTPALDALLFKSPVFDGLFPALMGSTLLIIIAILSALPLGLATGIYLAEYAGVRPKYWVSLAIEILAGLPSIVIGLAGFSLSILLYKLFGGNLTPCLLIAGCALGFLILPYIVSVTSSALESIPTSLRLTGIGLGFSRWQNLRHILLPEVLPAIARGLVLAIGRAAEDTAVIMLTGAVVSMGLPRSVFDQFEALPFYIYYISAQYSDKDELTRGFGAAILLLLLAIMLFCCTRLLTSRYKKQDIL